MRQRRALTVGLTSLVVLLACAPEGPPARPSSPLVLSGQALPDGYLEDWRGDEPIVAVRNAAGETEIRDVSGLLAPPIPGHEQAALRALRATSDGAIWACHDDGIALFRAGSWTHHDFASFLENGPCTSLDARAADDLYASVGTDICAWDGFVWDCFGFGQTRAVTLSPGHLWFVLPSTHYDDLTVIDTVSRATPGRVRLGTVGTTEVLRPVPDAERMVVLGFDGRERTLRSVDPDGIIAPLDAVDAVYASESESYLLRVLPTPVGACSQYVCGEGEAWAQLVVLHRMGTTTTEVGHVATVGPAGVPWRGLLVNGALRVRTSTGLLALP